MTLRFRLQSLVEKLLAILVATILVGSTLAFGGAVWWARPALALVMLLFLAAWLARALLEGTWRVIKSPLVPLGVLALGLAFAQVVPWPGRLSGLVSPGSRSVYAQGLLPGRAANEALDAPESAGVRVPLSVDRAATLRWLVGAAGCLALFWAAGQMTDRVGNLYVVWGSIVAAFSLNTVLGVVQLLGGASGMYACLNPGVAGEYGPSLDDLASAPNATALRPLPPASAEDTRPANASWAVQRPDRPFLIGTLMGGPGAYLALAALGLPLSLGLVLQMLAPRGSREPLWTRLRHHGLAGLLILLCVLLLAGGVLVGLLAGPVLALPFAIGLVLAGVPGAWASGVRWGAVALAGAAVFALVVGVFVGAFLPEPHVVGTPLAERAEWSAALGVWGDSLRILGRFPLLGTGLGSFSSIYPFYKSQDAAPNTALSSLVQWMVEAGLVGVSIFGLACAWCFWKLPRALKRVGTADRVLAFGLVGTVVCFAAFSALHWTVELAAVALAASAILGICDRWLAGGTDLFVERA